MNKYQLVALSVVGILAIIQVYEPPVSVTQDVDYFASDHMIDKEDCR